MSAYDEDATLSIDTLTSLPNCNGRIGATGMCLGGHLAFRCAMDKRVRAAVCYFATDIHSHTLGAGKKDDSLDRVKDIHGELAMVSHSQSFDYLQFFSLIPPPDLRQKRQPRPTRWSRPYPQDVTRDRHDVQFLRDGMGAACFHS